METYKKIVVKSQTTKKDETKCVCKKCGFHNPMSDVNFEEIKKRNKLTLEKMKINGLVNFENGSERSKFINEYIETNYKDLPYKGSASEESLKKLLGSEWTEKYLKDQDGK